MRDTKRNAQKDIHKCKSYLSNDGWDDDAFGISEAPIFQDWKNKLSVGYTSSKASAERFKIPKDSIILFNQYIQEGKSASDDHRNLFHIFTSFIAFVRPQSIGGVSCCSMNMLLFPWDCKAEPALCYHLKNLWIFSKNGSYSTFYRYFYNYISF